ncbi:MAG: zinc-binding alcohol dehydrogenase family protein [Neisseriaceae bacterium]|nr:zinc-binding alcohol dehydrogenase family protein [Neisseriaceae bacterium]MBP6860845.1 zinc-binding alcohol dehydrogenase family protein [Neisseriaceae bacterium]
MNAIGLFRYLPITDPDSLVDVVIDQPQPQGHDLLVQIKAISVNPVDTKVRAPKDKVETEAKLLGWDAAGVVTAVGDQVTLFQPGDEVYYAGSIDRPGCYAEYQLVEEAIVAHKPKTLSFTEAAALPLTSITAWESLFERMAISLDPEENSGDSLLIINAAGGVGSIASQLAKKAGLTVIGTASRPQSSDWALANGCDHIVDHHQPFAPQLAKLGLASVRYILCLHLPDPHWDNIVASIAPQGHVCCIVDSEAPLDMNLLKSKSVSFSWEFMFTRALFQTPDRIEQHCLLQQVADWVDDGSLKTTLNQQLQGLNAANLRDAHHLLESNQTIGKLVITV